MYDILPADLNRPDHARDFVTLLDEYARDPMGGGQPLPEAVKRDLPGALARRPGVHVLLAYVDGAPAGLANCMEGFSTFACKPLLNVHDFMVSAPFRGQGVARRLLAEVERRARALGCCKITLEVLQGNAPAQALYRSEGYDGYQLDARAGHALFWQKKLD
ncbi:GNAT family N-acetyltransferase [Orrella sp. JC864]|uniref:GNAT family N-acetyltransferase n=1 Tax=Orrella sp. JC864 TaxID=3120298 RepID=UPI0012BCF02E